MSRCADGHQVELRVWPIAGEEPPRDLPGLGRVVRSGPAADLPALVAEAAKAAQATPLPQVIGSDDPETRIQQMIASETVPFATQPPQLMVAIVSGAGRPEAAIAALERALGQTRPAILPPPPPARQLHQKVVAEIARPLAQGALGYVVPAPPPGTREGLTWRMLLYILTHDYSGRLGRSAIGDKGLAYHIASDYRTDGRRGWVTLSTGVDPAKADAMEAELKRQLRMLATDPPNAAEVEAARRHLLGRDHAAQANEEIADPTGAAVRRTGGLRSHRELEAVLRPSPLPTSAPPVPGFQPRHRPSMSM